MSTAGHGWAGVVLAGGRSSRMGRDKASIVRGGRTLLERAVDLLRPHMGSLLVVGDPLRHRVADVPVIADDAPGQGPLGGIVTALRHAPHDQLFVLACDMPGITAHFVQRLMAAMQHADDAVVAQCDGELEPLAGVYRRRCLPVFEAQLHAGRRKMADALAQVRTRYVQVCPGEEGWPADLFRNINSPGDL